ncbi:histidine--tRNA ligase [Sulfoacidibacillus thermotolerans]|uniref:Histidine--tRNA ligase n=1 Tax=Sulfoacidibacillus thermotolerans TaxID=1765684 RepID=A0A2U3D8Z7_SULT2|nr:histidine--tRNA ligase [Sulfoacidibacillus thermotolerans]PWI57749.1 histidine--tRNA ligase [Sulfoacidibacillus thermotolerans]
MSEFAKPRGTADILPEQAAEWRAIEDAARQLFETYHYREIRTPIFEHTEVFQRGVGDTTDIVQKEMYTFLDRGERSLTLRPEGTAGVVRAFVEEKLYGEMNTQKFYYLGPMFRYEKPQAGRYRQFHQYGVEVIGSSDPRVDAEVIGLGDHLLRQMGVKSFSLLLNSVGCPVCRARHREQLLAYLQPVRSELCKDCQSRFDKNPLRILDCKIDRDHPVVASAPKITDALCEDCARQFSQVQTYLDEMGISYEIDKTMVRGLDYYTQTAFEFVEGSIGAVSTILAGGRYNGLIQMLGGPDLPGIGFAGGVERLILARAAHGATQVGQDRVDVFVLALGEIATKPAARLLHELRSVGIKADSDYSGRKVKAQLKVADRLGARYVVLLGEDEVAAGQVAVRNLATREQVTIEQSELVSYLSEQVSLRF